MCVKWIARESSPLLFYSLSTNASSSGCSRYTIEQYLVHGLQPLRSFACILSSLKLTLRSSLQGYIRFGFWLFGLSMLFTPLWNLTSSVFITTLRFIQTFASLKGFDRTTRSITRIVLYTPSSTRTPSDFTEHRVTYSDTKLNRFSVGRLRAVGGSLQTAVKGKPLTIPLISSIRAN